MRSIVFLVSVALVFAANPTNPTWPGSYSCSVAGVMSGNPVQFFRIFEDSSLNKARVDGMVHFGGEYYFAETILDYTAGTEYIILYQFTNAKCFTRPINHTLPSPDFRSFRYVGESLVLLRPAYHWFANNTQDNHSYNYFDSVDLRLPLRIDLYDQNRQTVDIFTYFEFDETANDPSIYIVNPTLSSLCSPAPEEMAATNTFLLRNHH